MQGFIVLNQPHKSVGLQHVCQMSVTILLSEPGLAKSAEMP